MEKRLNIGLLVDDIDAVFTSPAVKGAELGAKAIDANLFIVPGRYLDNADEFQEHSRYGYQYNTLFEYVRSRHIDVLYVMMGMIGCRVDEGERIEFLKRYAGIPVVTLYTKTTGYPSIIFDNKCAFLEGMLHIIRDHHASRVGYVSGPKTNVDAMERLEAYREALAQTGIAYRDEYVIYGNFEESSEGMIGEFVDAHPELDALIFANDRMAHGGYRALEKRGMKPGRDICVLGFDNSEFAAGLNPPLSTVEANAAELCYRAVVQAEQYVKNGEIKDVYVDTRLVLRESCGCGNFNVRTVAGQMRIYNIMKEDCRREAYDGICDYLFNDYIEGEEPDRVKRNVEAFLDSLLECAKSDDRVIASSVVRDRFSVLLDRSTFRYTTPELVSNMLAALEAVICMSPDVVDSFGVMQLFVDLFRKMSLENWKLIDSGNAGVGRMTKFINTMTSEMFRMDSGEQIPYARTLENLSYVGISSAYLFMYQEPVRHLRFTRFEKPRRILYRAYYSDSTAHEVGMDDRNIDSEDIFAVPQLPHGRRVTMVLAPIFSGEDVYGVLMCEAGTESFRNIDPVSVHISTAIKSMVLLEQQDKIQARFEETMAKLTENNDLLQVMSRTDQLTGLFNRWGFLNEVNSVMTGSAAGETCVFMYADMDGLKNINDTYGHDDGDLALKAISEILREAFEDKAVISRFGGDEFVVFAKVRDEAEKDYYIRRIDEETEELNRNLGKPYRVEMSVGYCLADCSGETDVYQALASADRMLYHEKREKKRRRAEAQH